MHIPDGLIAGSLNIAAGVAAGGAVLFGSRRLRRTAELRPQLIPLLATTGSLVFAAQMLNFPIGGGTSGHILGAALAAGLLGPWNATMVMMLVVVIQAFCFGDGGISALGTNILNMAVIACWSGWLTSRALYSLVPKGRRTYLATSAAGAWVSVICAAGACSLELAWSGTAPTMVVVPAMLGAYAIIGIGEGLVTAGVLSALLAARPDQIPRWAAIGPNGHAAGVVGDEASRERQGHRRWSPAVLSLVFLVLAVALAGLASPLASNAPDGMERVIASTGSSTSPGAQVAATLSPFAEYQLPGIADARLSTRLAGTVGTLSVAVCGLLLIKLIRRKR